MVGRNLMGCLRWAFGGGQVHNCTRIEASVDVGIVASSQQGAPFLTREPIPFSGCFCCLKNSYVEPKSNSSLMHFLVSPISPSGSRKSKWNTHVTTLDIVEGSYMDVSSHTPTIVVSPDIYWVLTMCQTLLSTLHVLTNIILTRFMKWWISTLFSQMRRLRDRQVK